MKLLVVGGGGREHAIIKKLKENPSVTQIIAAPGNGGIAADAVCVPVGAKDIDGLVAPRAARAGRLCRGRAGRSAGAWRGGRADGGRYPVLRPEPRGGHHRGQQGLFQSIS